MKEWAEVGHRLDHAVRRGLTATAKPGAPLSGMGLEQA